LSGLLALLNLLASLGFGLINPFSECCFVLLKKWLDYLSIDSLCSFSLRDQKVGEEAKTNPFVERNHVKNERDESLGDIDNGKK